MTQLYLDSANTNDWREMAALGLCKRVTCNPLLIKAAGLPVDFATAHSLHETATRLGLEELHLQAWPDPDGNWFGVGETLANLGPIVVVKLPAIAAAMPAAKRLVQAGRRVLITAVSNPLHALWASQVGATFVAPYVGRLNEAGRPALALVAQLVGLQNQGGPKLIAASIRDMTTLGQMVAAGAYGVTVQKALLHEGIQDAQTALAVQQFEQARLGA